MDTVADWIALVDATYPERDAEGWDSVGLQVGDPEAEVAQVLVTLDVTPDVIDEATEQGCQLVLAHHPLLFRPLERLTPATASGRTALAAAAAGVAVLAAHTNVDAGVPGTTDPIADALGLVDRQPLAPVRRSELSDTAKLVTFVPADDVEDVLAAMSDAGAGVIGEYDRCSFRVPGSGTFRPSPTANPAVGARDELNTVAEERVEVVVPRFRVQAVLEALREAHPYEEVAVDVVALLDDNPRDRGIGILGRLPHVLSLREVCTRLTAAVPAPHLRVVGAPDRLVEVVAACGGAGDGFLADASAAGADCYVTGDLRHHVALDAATQGMALVDVGHHASEIAAMPAITDRLAAVAAERGMGARLLASAIDTCPWGSWWTAGPAEGEQEAPNT